ncbi:MAG: ABC transporter [Rhodopirellula sp.]|nr:ABC transporter [Rhodopirellula sp.]|tara:strand:+ start:614 stop:1549 length:936 start_codon:yes stop_codon:yes gene_type:complete
MLKISNLTKLYGIVIGVNDMSVDLPKGAYGLLGPNGSGKTTLLNLITGQLKPTVGQVEVLGERPWKNNVLMKRIGFSSALDILQTKTTGLEWVTLYTEMLGFRHKVAVDMAHKALDRVGLSGTDRERGIDQYSRGMKQRCKIAQAIAHEPELLLLDEPFAGLDPIARFELTTILTNWVEEGRGLLISSHILHELESICDSFLLTMTGRLLASGTIQEIHKLMKNVPKKIWIRTPDAPQIAVTLQSLEHIIGIDFHEDQGGIDVRTTAPNDFYRALPSILIEQKLRIVEMESDDDSLDSVFEKLLNLHRGES